LFLLNCLFITFIISTTVKVIDTASRKLRVVCRCFVFTASVTIRSKAANEVIKTNMGSKNTKQALNANESAAADKLVSFL